MQIGLVGRRSRDPVRGLLGFEHPRAERAASSAPASAAAATGCVVGVSWNNYQEERWAKWDEPAIKAALEAGGATYISNDAKSSAETQATNVENLISQGAKVLIILAQDGTAIKPSVAKAISDGVPVIAYDRLIEDPGALYITFDNKLVGKMQAEAVLAVRSRGQLRRHQGQQGRRERRLPARAAWSRPVSLTSARPIRTARSRSSARPTPTTGIRPTPRRRWSSS